MILIVSPNLLFFEVMYQIQILLCFPLIYLAFYSEKSGHHLFDSIIYLKGSESSRKIHKIIHWCTFWFYIIESEVASRRILRTMSYDQNMYGAELLELCRNWKMNLYLFFLFLHFSCTYNQVTAVYLSHVHNSPTSSSLKSLFPPLWWATYILKLSHHLKQV